MTMYVDRSTYDIRQRKDGGEQEKGEEIHFGIPLVLLASEVSRVMEENGSDDQEEE